jgi:hypothetical protein
LNQQANQQPGQPGDLQANQQDNQGNAQGGQGNQQGGNQQGNQQGSQAGGQQAGNQPGGAQQGGQGGAFGGAFAGGPRGGYYGGGGPGGYYDPTRDRIWGPYGPGFRWDPQQIAEARDRLQTAGDDLIALGGRLRTQGQGLSDEQMRAVRELGERLRAGLAGNPNPDLIARELQNIGNLVDQLELQLTDDGQNGSGPVIRTAAPVKVERGYEDAVAEYYRRLSESKL